MTANRTQREKNKEKLLHGFVKVDRRYKLDGNYHADGLNHDTIQIQTAPSKIVQQKVIPTKRMVFTTMRAEESREYFTEFCLRRRVER